MEKINTSNANVEKKNEYTVSGTVRDSNPKPLEGAVVKVFDKDIRSEQALGKPVRTDEAGTYEVEYTHAQFAATDEVEVEGSNVTFYCN